MANNLTILAVIHINASYPPYFFNREFQQVFEAMQNFINDASTDKKQTPFEYHNF